MREPVVRAIKLHSYSSLEEEKRAPSGWCELDHHDCNRRGLHPWCRAHMEKRVVKRDTTTVPEKTKKVGILPTNGKSNEGNEGKNYPESCTEGSAHSISLSSVYGHCQNRGEATN